MYIKLFILKFINMLINVSAFTLYFSSHVISSLMKRSNPKSLLRYLLVCTRRPAMRARTYAPTVVCVWARTPVFVVRWLIKNPAFYLRLLDYIVSTDRTVRCALRVCFIAVVCCYGNHRHHHRGRR